MLPFPFCFFSNDDMPPYLKDILGDKPLDTLEELCNLIEKAKTAKPGTVDINRLRYARDVFKRLHAVNKKIHGTDPNGAQVVEEINTIVYDTERNLN